MRDGGLSSMLRGPAFARVRHVARNIADNNVERPIARLLYVRRMLEGSAPNAPMLMHFGDSSLIHISAQDADPRRLGEMLAGDMGMPSAQYYGPGYSAALFAELVRLVGDRPRPAAVVVSLGMRSTTHLHVIRHPKWGYQRSLAALRAAKSVDAKLLAKLVRRTASESDYATFYALERTSRWGLGKTMGDYRLGLRGYDGPNEPPERQRLLFDYFHGEYAAGSVGLADWTLLGERLRAWNVPVVAYRSWMPIEEGNRVLGPSFAEHLEENFRVVEDTFFDALGYRSMVEFGPLPDDTFIDHTDGTEHLNEAGRRAVVDALAPALRNALA